MDLLELFDLSTAVVMLLACVLFHSARLWEGFRTQDHVVTAVRACLSVSVELLVAATTGSQLVGRVVESLTRTERWAEAFVFWNCIMMEAAQNNNQVFVEATQCLDAIGLSSMAFFGSVDEGFYDRGRARDALYRILGGSTALHLMGCPMFVMLMTRFMGEAFLEAAMNPEFQLHDDYTMAYNGCGWHEERPQRQLASRATIGPVAAGMLLTMSQLLESLRIRLVAGESADFVQLL